ncbi:MAG: baseplate J/gp47 family protein [Roseiarcus sp.]|jgi:phage-related baseplate assembly protein
MSTFATIDLSALPQPAAVQTWTFAGIVQARLADFTSRMNAAGIAYDTSALESEPAVMLQETGAYREGLVYQRVNEAVLATSLAWSQGTDLDVVAATFQTIRAPGELDPSLRRRAQLAWEALSQGGSYGGYRYKALSAAPVDLADVAVYGGEVAGVAPGQVMIVCLGVAANGVPAPASLAAVRARFPRANRKVNDQVVVRAVNPALYSVDATIILNPGPDAATVVAAQTSALNAFAAARRAIGASVTPGNIESVLGYSAPALVYDVVVRSPAATVGGDPFSAPILSGARVVWQARS